MCQVSVVVVTILNFAVRIAAIIVLEAPSWLHRSCRPSSRAVAVMRASSIAALVFRAWSRDVRLLLLPPPLLLLLLLLRFPQL
jgi:hypothetical protein